MFLKLGHTKLVVFNYSRKLTLECYKLTKTFSSDEKFAMTSQIRRAALSVHLNIAEGCSRKSITERRRFFEIARGSLIELDTAFDIAVELGYIVKEPTLLRLEDLILHTFKILSGLISSQERKPNP